MKRSFVFEGTEPVRLDILLAGIFDGLSRSKVSDFIKNEGVVIDGKPVRKAGTIVYSGNQLEWKDGSRNAYEKPGKVQPNKELYCDILYEDNACIIINKAPGILTHPTADPASFRTSVASWLLAYLGKSPTANSERPGIVHRLDQWTGGCLLLAKTEQALSFYASAFEQRTVVKEYLALVEGTLQYPAGKIDAPIGRDNKRRTAMGLDTQGRHATTSYTVLETGNLYGVAVSLLRLQLHTGRTHQIRVHLSSIGHPVVGDPIYGAKMLPSELSGQWLHAQSLTVPRFQDATKTISAQAPLPASFLQVLTMAGIPPSSWQ